MLTKKRMVGAFAVVTVMVAAALVPSVLAGPGPQADPDSSEGSTVTWTRDGDANTAAIDQTNIEFVALDPGCRFFDTRAAGGTFGAGEARDLSVLDAAIPSQGAAGPCGIPGHAVAVDMSLSTLGNSPTNPGFTRAGPGGVDPSPTVLQFLKNQGNSVTTTVPLSADGKVRIRVFAASTGMVGDLLGYWQHTLHGNVLSNGTLFSGSPGVVSIAKGTTGDYDITFDRPVFPECSYTATPRANTSARVITFSVGGSDTVRFDGRAISDNSESDVAFTFMIEC